jgi:hypothetical protein
VITFISALSNPLSSHLPNVTTKVATAESSSPPLWQQREYGWTPLFYVLNGTISTCIQILVMFVSKRARKVLNFLLHFYRTFFLNYFKAIA